MNLKIYFLFAIALLQDRFHSSFILILFDLHLHVFEVEFIEKFIIYCLLTLRT